MEPTPNASPARRERPLVLVAEDMELMVRLMRLHLERAGYDVLAVPDGEQALARSELFAQVKRILALRPQGGDDTAPGTAQSDALSG